MTQISLLNSSDKAKLQQICRSRLNWSDGGRWIGHGNKPNCDVTETLKKRLVMKMHFPTDKDAEKWNATVDNSMRYTGYAASALVALTPIVIAATFGTAITLPATASFITSIGTNVALGESLAKVEVPKVTRGSTLYITVSYEKNWGPFQKQQFFTQKTHLSIQNHRRKVTFERENTSKYRLNEIPEGLINIMKFPDKGVITLSYK
ncbi:hypothetical protein TUMSATVNIG1_01040 [Vibrio nigripulchritudo]|uniref:hypothetical protein n=1 Tax=Vibrio nigripulchritudo TaxID=28173 RepID=UPI00190A1768|nr:hypothetical protein [Vibrio nigripulchritudo]BCL68167.1 hypothetical protein VNTUMSATTG_01040 [Vibrio nigripulchritudo]BDU29495.1 hypothetical protein TUMSATVNIG1_01040 [Vibrio nigripulchritudo]